jgi:hypothetical protein
MYSIFKMTVLREITLDYAYPDSAGALYVVTFITFCTALLPIDDPIGHDDKKVTIVTAHGT